MRDIYVVITERDNDKALDNEGAIIHEQYLKAGRSLEDIIHRGVGFRGQFGQTYIGKVEVLGTIEQLTKKEKG